MQKKHGGGRHMKKKKNLSNLSTHIPELVTIGKPSNIHIEP